MPDTKNINGPPEISDKEFEMASQYVDQTIDILDMELHTSRIPIGMFLVGMARFIGHEIRKATSALGPKRRREQVKAFSKIIEVNSIAEDGDDDASEIS
jgi:hypothetical protein